MYNMMSGAAVSSNILFLWPLHILSVIAFFTGVLLLLFWAYKHLSGQQLWKWGWVLVILGSIVCLFTVATMGHPWVGGYGSRTSGIKMMWNQGVKSDDAAQAKEEAEGKEIFDKLQSKQLKCTDVTDSDFELVGEYVMGQRLGSAAHLQMNTMMKTMMGDAGEEQMHAQMGKRATGC